MIMNEPKRFHIKPFSWLQRTLKLVLIIEPLKGGSKYVALIEPFKNLFFTSECYRIDNFLNLWYA